LKLDFCDCDELFCNKLHLRVQSGEIYRGDNHFLMIDLPNYDEKEAEKYRKAIIDKLHTKHFQPNVNYQRSKNTIAESSRS